MLDYLGKYSDSRVESESKGASMTLTISWALDILSCRIWKDYAFRTRESFTMESARNVFQVLFISVRSTKHIKRVKRLKSYVL